MPDLKFQPPSRPSALVRQGGGPGHTRTLQNANREALQHLGLPINASGDPKGRVLRQLRLERGIDPSLLATQACMSLSQLYELEDGGNSRFYSDSLRRQAGRRVARLLGLDWDRMEQEERSMSYAPSNVVPLQRPTIQAASTAPLPPEIVEVKVRVAPEQSSVITMEMDASSSAIAVPDSQAVSMGLASPASETVLIDPPTVPYTTTLAEPEKGSSGWTTVITLMLMTAAGAAAAYAFVEYSPYRLYWPW